MKSGRKNIGLWAKKVKDTTFQNSTQMTENMGTHLIRQMGYKS